MDDRAITFDFHNTLVDCDAWFELEVRQLVSAFLAWEGRRRAAPVAAETLAAADGAYRRLRLAIMEHGREESAERCVALVMGELGLVPEAIAIAGGIEALMRETLATAEAAPGAVDTVKTLYAAGVPLGIVSSAVYHPFLEWSLDRFGLLDCFATVTTSASVGFYKSRPEIYLRAVERLGVEPGNAVHVGDSYRFDVEGARRAGLRAVWVQRDPVERPGAGTEAPELTLPSLSGAAAPLLALLRSPSP